MGGGWCAVIRMELYCYRLGACMLLFACCNEFKKQITSKSILLLGFNGVLHGIQLPFMCYFSCAEQNGYWFFFQYVLLPRYIIFLNWNFDTHRLILPQKRDFASQIYAGRPILYSIHAGTTPGSPNGTVFLANICVACFLIRLYIVCCLIKYEALIFALHLIINSQNNW